MMKDISNKNTSQLFYLSFVADFKGITKSGRNLFSSLGNLMLCDETYRRNKIKLYKNNKKTREQELEDKVVVELCDNYNRSGDNFFTAFQRGVSKHLIGQLKERSLKTLKFL